MLKSIIIFVVGFIIGYIIIRIVNHYTDNDDNALYVKVLIKKNGEWVAPTEKELLEALNNHEPINLETKECQRQKHNNY